MRHRRPTTRETRDALEGILKQVALALDVSREYLHQILAGVKSDPFAYFKELFTAVASVAPSRSRIWLTELIAIQERAETATPLKRSIDDAYNKAIDEVSDVLKAACCPHTPRLVKRKEALEASDAWRVYAELHDDPDGFIETEAQFS